MPKVTLKSHFDSIRDIKFCANNELLVSVSEDCMMKIWDVKSFKAGDDDIEPIYTYRGHTEPLFALTTNQRQLVEHTLIYSAGSEGIIRVWKVPQQIAPGKYPSSDGKNHCVGVFSSHKDVVWQLVHHPVDNMLLSVSADASVKLWKSFDYLNADYQEFESIEQSTNHCLMGSFI